MDFQFARFASPATDLSLFFLTSTTKIFRDAHLAELIQYYHASLSETVRHCGSNPEHVFTFKQLEYQLKTFSKYGVRLCLMYLSVSVPDPSNVRPMNECSDSVDVDNDGIKTFSSLEGECEKAFMIQVNDSIRDALRYGW